MSTYTIAYQPELDGFTSFFSFAPENMCGLNNYLYSFKSGQIWKHNINETRNNFYGVQYDSVVNISMNDEPTEIKLFKTFAYAGIFPADKVGVTFSTFLSSREFTGAIPATDFVVKEGEAYANIQSDASTFTTTMKEQGVGQLYFKGATPFRYQVKTPPIQPPAVGATNGDTLYFRSTAGATGIIGIIIAYTYDPTTSIATFFTATETQIPAYGDILIISKNKVSESYGLRGPYMMSAITITGTEKVEIFSVSSSISKSFP